MKLGLQWWKKDGDGQGKRRRCEGTCSAPSPSGPRTAVGSCPGLRYQSPSTWRTPLNEIPVGVGPVI